MDVHLEVSVPMAKAMEERGKIATKERLGA
jgi:hypothetical protein